MKQEELSSFWKKDKAFPSFSLRRLFQSRPDWGTPALIKLSPREDCCLP